MRPNELCQEMIENRSKRDENGCWIWPSISRRTGYGEVSIGGKTVRAHRASWTAHFGEIPSGMFVCHSCDVRCCVNPSHLWLGTTDENMADMVRKGRQARGLKIKGPCRTFGPEHPRTVIPPGNAIIIQMLSRSEAAFQYEIADAFKTTQGNVSKIKRSATRSRG